MQTGINNNSKFVSLQGTSLDRSKLKGSKPVLKSGFKPVYNNSYEKFLSNVNESDLKHMNTININGKNFHLLESLRPHQPHEAAHKEQLRLAKEMTAEQKILEHIKEESSRQYTLRDTVSKYASHNNFSFRNNPNFRFDANKRREPQFFTSKDGANQLQFLRPSEKHIYKLEQKMNTNPEFLKKLQLAEADAFTKKAFLQENRGAKEPPMAKRQSLSVTNNEVTNNNHNVKISNKMNTYIIIMNDQKDLGASPAKPPEEGSSQQQHSGHSSQKPLPSGSPLGRLRANFRNRGRAEQS